MYDRYIKLLEEKGVKTSDVCRATGIVASTFSNWKKGKSIPKQDKIKKIADYFNVSVDYLIDGKEKVFIESQAEIDIALTEQNERIKQYMLKFANLSEDKRNAIISIIDSYEKE